MMRKLSENQRVAEFHKEDGNRFYQEGWFDQAIHCYSQAIQCEPENPLFYTNRAMALLRAGAPQDALRDAEFAIRLDPTSKGRLRQAQALIMLGHMVPALRALRQAASVASDSAETQEIERMIQKCESKLAVQQSTGGANPHQSIEQQHGYDLSNPDIAKTITDLYEDIEVVLPTRQLLADIANLQRSTTTLASMQKTLEQFEGGAIPRVSNAALGSAYEKVTEAQDVLRTAAGGTDAAAFREALEKRNAAVGELRALLSNTISAIDNFGSFEQFQSQNEYARNLMVLKDEVKPLLDEAQTLLGGIPDRFRAAVARTNGAAKIFHNALRAEAQLAEEVGLKDAVVMKSYQEAVVRVCTEEAMAELQKVSEERQKHIADICETVSTYRNFLDMYSKSQAESSQYNALKDEFEARRLALERRRISLGAELEWKKVTGVTEEKLEAEHKELEQVMEQLEMIKKKQEEHNAEVQKLVESVRPELLWKGQDVQEEAAEDESEEVSESQAQPQEVLLSQLYRALSGNQGVILYPSSIRQQ